jgi:SAM-dependent methyltransferase
MFQAMLWAQPPPRYVRPMPTDPTKPRTLNRPEPILSHSAQPVDQDHSPDQAAQRLRDGEVLIVTDHFSTGAEILSRLHTLLGPLPEQARYMEKKEFKRTFRQAALRLIAPIEDHRLALVDARPIGFLAQLYPEHPGFFLPFLVIQELHGAWLWFEEGTHLAVLGHRIHPYFGTYVPNRTTHLELFGTWLSQYTGPRTQAVDVGTGSGVLALMLAWGGFERVLATDNNPNAIESVERQLARSKPRPPVELDLCDLLGSDPTPNDLIVFNPPWMQGEVDDLLDQALYFEPGLFERFFDQALEKLAPDGRVVLVFSNVIQLVQPNVPHPILSELDRARFRLVSKLQRKVKGSPKPGGGRRRTREKVEVWELARA